MIKIDENDTLWKFYKRHYKYKHEGLPHPKNLCNYFWTAVCGACKAFYFDMNAIVVFLVLGGTCAALYGWQRYLGIFDAKVSVLNVFVCLFFTVTIGFTGFFAAFEVLYRFFTYWNDKNPLISMVTGFSLGLIGFGVLMSFLLVGNGGTWTWWHLLYGFLTEFAALAVLAAILGVIFLIHGDHNLAKNVRQYFGAVKNRVCPLIDPPQSWKDSQREKELNVTDS